MNRYDKHIRTTLWIVSFLTVGFIAFSLIVFLKDETLSASLPSNTSKYSQYGSFIGGVIASIFGFATFILLLYTFFLQKSDSEQTFKVLNQQGFESTFFNMLNYLIAQINSATGSIDLTPSYSHKIPRGQTQGVSYFATLMNSYLNWFRITNNNNSSPMHRLAIMKMVGITDQDAVQNVYDEFYNSFYDKHNHSLGHLFRLCHNLIKYIDSSESYNNNDPSFYINIVQSQLPDSFLSVLFYNVLSSNSKNSAGDFEFRERLDKYNFFQNIRCDSIPDELFLNFFPNTTFKNLDRKAT